MTTRAPEAPLAGHPLVDAGDRARDRTRTFASLSIPLYRYLWIAGIFSFLAIQVQVIARGWLAFQLTGSNTGLGGVYLGFGIPMLIATPIGGVAADRLSKRKIMLVSQGCLVASAAFVGVAVAFDFVTYWMLIVSAGVQAAAFAFFGPARMAFTADLVGRDNLANAVVLGQMSMNGTRVFGPALAGVLIGVAYFGTAGVYFMSAVFTLVAFFVVAANMPAGRPRDDRVYRLPREELKDGLVYVRQRPELLLLVTTSFVVVMFAFPYLAFLPAVASDIHGAGSGVYGLMSGVSAIGAVAASLLIASRAGSQRAWRMQTIAGVGFGVSVALLPAVPSLGLCMAVVFVVGASASVFQSMNNSIALTVTDIEYHGRVQSLMMLSFSGFGMAALPLGLLADALGLRFTLGLMGGVTLGAMAVYAVIKRRLASRELDLAAA